MKRLLALLALLPSLAWAQFYNWPVSGTLTAPAPVAPVGLTRSGVNVLVDPVTTQASVFIWEQPDNLQTVISMTAPDPVALWPKGTIVTIIVANNSGGAAQNPSFSGFGMGSFAPPNNGFAQAIEFVFVNAAIGWQEISRSAANMTTNL